jgi:hypothetical protein
MRPAVLKHLENSFIYQKPILIGLMSKESSETGKCHEARCFKQLAISFIYQKPILIGLMSKESSETGKMSMTGINEMRRSSVPLSKRIRMPETMSSTYLRYLLKKLISLSLFYSFSYKINRKKGGVNFE